jgi:PD-(D/E)XK nuclease superfamily protein
MTEKVNIILDASKIDLFETCPARFNFRYNHNKVLPVSSKPFGKRDSLDLGGLGHNGLEVYYNMLMEGAPYDDRIHACLMKIRELSADPSKSNSEPDDVAILLSAVERSLDYWRAEDENCLEILAVESPFAYVLYEDDTVRIIISGKIDLLVNYHGIGRSASYDNLPIDHKTFSRDGVVRRKSNQFINYCAAVGSNYLVVNRIGLYDQNVKSPKSAEESFSRLPMSYDPIYIADWKKNLTKMLLNEYLTCVGENSWPEKPTSCNKFNRLCEYYAICDSSGEDSKMNKLENEYVDGEVWDVTKNMSNGVE